MAPKREIETIYGLVISCMEDREAPSGADLRFFLKGGGGGTTKELPFLTPIFAMFNIKTLTSSYVSLQHQ